MATAYSGRHLQRIRQAVWASYPHVCHLCGEPIATFEQMEPDHLEPRSRGTLPGMHDLPNLRPAHGTRSRERCNQRRGNKPVDQYRRVRDIDHLAWFKEGDR